MTTHVLKDSKYRIIGYIDTLPNGNQIAKDSQFRVVGYYEKSADVTKDSFFRTVGFGNQLPALVR